MPRTGRIVLSGYPHHIVQRGHNLPRTVTPCNSRAALPGLLLSVRHQHLLTKHLRHAQ